MNRRKLAGLNRSLDAVLRQYESILTLIVKNYLMVEVIAFQDSQTAHKIRDYINFCITKSCRTLLAIQILLEFKFNEDVLILLRSVYENYLSLVYILNHPENIADFIDKPIGVKTGHFSHPKHGGRTDYRKIIDPKTKEELPYGIRISTKAQGSLYKPDFSLYKHIYTYLSELIHPHFMSSGNYRDESQCFYTYSNLTNNFEAKFLTSYIFTILLVEVFEIESDELEIPEMTKMRKSIIKGYEICSSIIDLLSYEELEKEIACDMRSRLKEIRNKEWFLRS